MADRPILFSAPMVRAILAGTKTQTRRIAKGVATRHAITGEALAKLDSAGPRVACPYGQPGDRLWVRETWQAISDTARARRIIENPRPNFGWVEYASGPHKEGNELPPKWRPSIHMPRWASRITLEVTGVRVERLLDISDADAKAEGLVPRIGLGRHECWGLPEWGDPARGSNPSLWNCSAVQAYRALWNQINGAGSWDENPWVWVVCFRRVEA